MYQQYSSIFNNQVLWSLLLCTCLHSPQWQHWRICTVMHHDVFLDRSGLEVRQDLKTCHLWENALLSKLKFCMTLIWWSMHWCAAFCIGEHLMLFVIFVVLKIAFSVIVSFIHGCTVAKTSDCLCWDCFGMFWINFVWHICDLWAADQTSLEERFAFCSLLQSPRTRTMPDIAKSDISPNLDRDKMFNELWWLNYCFCEGVGIGAVGNPFFGGEAVNICCHSRCEMTDVGDPFCSNVRVCLCLTDQCALPPAEGSPICVCFNKKLAGADGWSGQQLFDWSTSFGDTFWLYYIFCMGLGFSAPQANGRPLFAVQTKELCIKGGTKLATPMEGGKLCSMVSTRLCFWEQCAMPPAEGAPMFSCFNLLNKKGASAKPLAYGA